MNNAQIVDFFKDKPYLAYPVYVCGDSKECAMRILPARAVPTPLYQGNKISIRTSEDISQTEGLLSVEDITLVIIDTQ
ncbi:MAG: hypothetical protein UT41_C0002G0131 [Candidatus Wolfebacteria bacterium GW2011_GWC2_39_22]|uniref:Uncharacterized protein n=2 Tax=Candidatus Wolfeibacteriota TaxID=1752735 RepID=A0A0G1H901_9BACT|nr:MAG: hypothetical protein UT41_C0002G0131 [Candidatus Wolfebacteria bacterium GW2011_GWC2_39_22]KKT43265.1 MAG: hypothetical protein UW32_C0002G0126 [Candidatus Wolfebacteria bacterium GW2011_GWE2_44_13]